MTEEAPKKLVELRDLQLYFNQGKANEVRAINLNHIVC